MLGRLFNFRGLIVYLPENKFVAWTNRIKGVLGSNKTRYKELETIIGKMVHAGIKVSQIHHFMSRLRGLLWRSHNRRSIKLTDPTRKVLELMLFFLAKAKDGLI